MSSEFTVSVVIPAYRVTDYIAQALDSVLGQSYPATEVIVVNDGCPDTGRLDEAVRPYLARIRYITRENGGPSAARNTAIRAATGSLIAFLDGDDYWEPLFLERQVEYLRAHPEIDLVYTDAVYFEDGRVVGSLMETAPSEGEATLHALLEGRCTVATTTVVARRERLIAAGLFDEEIGNYSEDFDLWLRVLHSGGRIGYQREALVHHRVHPASLTARPLQLPRGALRVLRKARETMVLTPTELAALDERVALIASDIRVDEAKRMLLAGEYPAAADRLRESVRLRPVLKRRIALLLVLLAPRLLRRAISLQARR